MAQPKNPEPIGKGANIREITFGRIFNLGNYENFRIELTATVGPTQSVEEVMLALDKAVIRARNECLNGGK